MSLYSVKKSFKAQFARFGLSNADHMRAWVDFLGALVDGGAISDHTYLRALRVKV